MPEPRPGEINLRRREFDGRLLVYQFSPSAERAMQWEIIAVKKVKKP